MGFPADSVVKKSTCSAGDVGSIPGLERSSGGGNGKTISVFLPRRSHGQRSTSSYSPWGLKESDMAERLNSKTEVTLEAMDSARWPFSRREEDCHFGKPGM